MIVICFKLLQHPLRNSWGALSWYRPSQDVADAICTRYACGIPPTSCCPTRVSPLLGKEFFVGGQLKQS